MPKALTVKCAALSKEWLDSAEAELSSAAHLRAVGNDWPSVYWHSGFAVEKMLKAIRIRKQGLEVWPDADKGTKWHDLDFVARQASITEDRKREARRSRAFQAYWLTVKDWNHQKRYPGHNLNEREARDILKAVANPTAGVMKWLLQIYRSI